MFKKVNWSKIGNKIEDGAKKAYEDQKKPVNDSLKQIKQAADNAYEAQKDFVNEKIHAEKERVAREVNKKPQAKAEADVQANKLSAEQQKTEQLLAKIEQAKAQKAAKEAAELKAAQEENNALKALLKSLEEDGSAQPSDSESDEFMTDLANSMNTLEQEHQILIPNYSGTVAITGSQTEAPL